MVLTEAKVIFCTICFFRWATHTRTYHFLSKNRTKFTCLNVKRSTTERIFYFVDASIHRLLYLAANRIPLWNSRNLFIQMDGSVLINIYASVNVSILTFWQLIRPISVILCHIFAAKKIICTGKYGQFILNNFVGKWDKWCNKYANTLR